jgi:hypothetical protein
MLIGEFAALFAQRPSAFAWFIGAGASRMSGLPTAQDVISDLKRQYYCSEEGEEISLQDMHSDAVRDRIQSFMDARGFPPLWSAEEYSGYFDKIFGEDKERQRSYLRRILSDDRLKLTIGNRVLAAMLAAGYTRAAFTTNFDAVVESAYAEVAERPLPVFHLEGSGAALQALNQEEFPLYVKMHGDFRYDSVKNLTSDLAEQDQRLSQAFVAAASRFGLVVSGYSGRDHSVMSLLHEALDQPNAFPAGLFWTEIKGARIAQGVSHLIDHAHAKGVRTSVIDIETYDTLMLRLWRNIENKPPELDARVRRSARATVAIPLPPSKGSRPLLRLNALPVRELPRKALALRIARAVEWKELRELERQTHHKVLFTKGKNILAWGPVDQIAALFGRDFAGADPVDLPDQPDAPEDLHLRGFFEAGLVTALARGRPLIPRTTRTGALLIANRKAKDASSLDRVKGEVGSLFGSVGKLMTPATEEHPEPEPLFWAEALRLSLNWKAERPWLLVDPDVWIWPPRARELARDFLDGKRRGRFNKPYNDLVGAWIDTLFGARSEPTDLAVSLGVGSAGAEAATFKIGSQTGYSWRHVA